MQQPYVYPRTYTPEEIEAGLSARGGFTYAQLREWGVPIPPPKGWRKAITRYSPHPPRPRPVVPPVAKPGQLDLVDWLAKAADDTPPWEEIPFQKTFW